MFHGQVGIALCFVERPFQLHEVARGFASVFFVGRTPVQQVDLLGSVHQAMDQIRVPRLPFTGSGKMQGMPQIEREEAVGHGGLGYGAFVHVQHDDPVKIQSTGLGEAHDLESLVGLAQQIHALLTKQPPNHGTHFLGMCHRCMGLLESLHHGQYGSEAAPSGRNPWHGAFLVVLHVFGEGLGQRLHAAFQGLCPRRHGVEEVRGLVGFQRTQVIQCFGPLWCALFAEVVGFDPRLGRVRAANQSLAFRAS